MLEAQDRNRVQELVPIRHGRMLVSPFTFYRGAAAIMAADLGVDTEVRARVQLCGDAHLSNFGVFAAPDRRLIFDINDFDETHPGPFEWDVKRLAASFAVAGRDRGFKEREGRAAVTAAAREYREEMRRLAAMRNIDVWYERLDVEAFEQYRSQVSRRGARSFDKATSPRPRARTACGRSTKLTREDDGELRIVSDPPLIVPIEELVLEQQLKAVETAAGESAGPVPRDSRPRRPPSGRRLSVRRTRPTRSSASAASGPAPGSCCCSAATQRIHSSCRSRRRRPRCSSPSPGRASSSTRAGGWSRASG